MRGRRWWAILALCGALVGSRLEAGKVLEAPTRMAMTDLNQLMVMEVVDHLDAGRVRCRRITDIWGEPSAEEVEVRFFDRAGDLRPGERYVVAYTRYRRNLLVRDLREIDPEGPQVVRLAVVDLAVVPETDELLTLFGERQDGPSRAKHLEAAMTLVRSGDAHERRFGLAEVGLGADLRAIVRPEDAMVLAALLKDATVPEIERELILTAAADFPEAARGDWLTDGARGILAEDARPELDLATYRPALIERSLETLPASNDPETLDLFVRWLPSNSPGVVKAAIAALDHLDSEMAQERAFELLQELDSGSAAYRVLLHYTRNAPQPWGEDDGVVGDGLP